MDPKVVGGADGFRSALVLDVLEGVSDVEVEVEVDGEELEQEQAASPRPNRATARQGVRMVEFFIAAG